jgi:hypothetical protein
MILTKTLRFALLCGACVLAAPASAQTAVSQDRVSASDVATTPLSDFNLKKDEVPAVLITAREKPYNLAGMTRCTSISAEIAQLDAVLGDDIDIARDDGGAKVSVGSVAKSLVRSLIPFGGLRLDVLHIVGQRVFVDRAVVDLHTRRPCRPSRRTRRRCASSIRRRRDRGNPRARGRRGFPCGCGRRGG